MAKYTDLFLEKDGLTGINDQARLLNIGHKGFEGLLPSIGAIIDGTHMRHIYLTHCMLVKML